MVLRRFRAHGFGFLFYASCSSLLLAGTFAALEDGRDIHPSSTEEHCDHSLMPVLTKFDFKKFSGTWYELARTASGYIDLTDGSWNFTMSKTSTRFVYSGRNSDDECVHPISGFITVSSETLGGLELHYRTQSTPVKERIRILHTDYDTVAIVYTCLLIEKNGECHPAAVFASIWTRLPHVDVTVFNSAMQFLTKNVCVDKSSVLISTRVGPCVESMMTKGTVIDTSPAIPQCSDDAPCGIHCPPCCRKISSCVVCDCENVILEDFDRCYTMQECPIDCIFKERYKGCFMCKCSDLKRKEFSPPGVCTETMEPGHCYLDCANVCEENDHKKVEKFFYDVYARDCLPFHYTGCGGNKNNFHSKQECQSRCLGLTFSSPDGADTVKSQILQITILQLLLLILL